MTEQPATPPAHGPGWCAGPPVCTADRPAHPTLPTMHRSRIASVAGSGGTVNSRIVQVEGDAEPRIVLQSTGYAIGGGAEMSLGAMEDVIKNLNDQLNAARVAMRRPPAPVQRQGGDGVAATQR